MISFIILDIFNELNSIQDTIDSIPIKNNEIIIITNKNRQLNNTIQLYKVDKDISIGAAANLGLSLSKQDYITFSFPGAIYFTNDCITLLNNLCNKNYNVIVFPWTINNNLLQDNMNNYLFGKFYKRSFLNFYNINFIENLILLTQLNWNYTIFSLAKNNVYFEIEQPCGSLSIEIIQFKEQLYDNYFYQNYLNEYLIHAQNNIACLEQNGVNDSHLAQIITNQFIDLYFIYYTLSNHNLQESDNLFKAVQERFFNTLFIKYIQNINPIDLVKCYNETFVNIFLTQNRLMESISKFNTINPVTWIEILSKN